MLNKSPVNEFSARGGSAFGGQSCHNNNRARARFLHVGSPLADDSCRLWRTNLRPLLFLVMIGVWAATAVGTDRYVVPPGTAGTTAGIPYNAWTNAATSIIDAVSVAAVNETVWVTNGTYVLTNQIVITNNIRVRGYNWAGPLGRPVVDGNGSHRCFYFSNSYPIVESFIITNGCASNDQSGGYGYAGCGGGILAYQNSIVSNCIFVNNVATNWGGGLHMPSSGHVITNCTFMGNRAVRGGGIAFYVGNQSYVRSCVISGNTATSRGGGIWGWVGNNNGISNCTIVNNNGAGVYWEDINGFIKNSIINNNTAGGVFLQGNISVQNCTIIGNTNSGYGGGVYVNVQGYLNNCTIAGNLAGVMAGGVYLNGTSNTNIWMQNCVVSNNVAATDGGGIRVRADKTALVGLIINCTVVNNYAMNGHGGGINLSEGGRVQNCLIAGNHASTSTARYGGGIYADNIGNDTGYVGSCTIASNEAGRGGGIFLNGGNNAVTNCIVYFNTANSSYPTEQDVYGASTCFFYCCTSSNLPGSQGNITNDPLFVDRHAGSWRLLAASPCVNTGTNQDWMTNSYDLDGRMRIRYGTVDIGAYETIYAGTMFTIP